MMHTREYVKLLLSPWAYNQDQPLARLQSRLALLGGAEWCRLTANGRSGLYVACKALRPTPGDEILVQAFTCVAAVNPLVWAGLKPVFVDPDPESLSMSVEEARRALSPRTRAILLQHTFGIPGPVDQIADLARERGIVLIEDCAHSLGVEIEGKPLGSFGDLAMFSFGIDKQLSSKTGGAVTSPNALLQPAVDAQWRMLPRLSSAETGRWLLFPLIRRLLRRMPPSRARRLESVLWRSGVLRQAVAPAELTGACPPGTPSKLTGALASVVLDELDSLESLQAWRRQIVSTYRDALGDVPGVTIPTKADGPLLRFPLLLSDRATRDRVKTNLVAQGFDVVSWYDPPVFPYGVDLTHIGYSSKATPVAEDLAARILCLPTGRNISQAGSEALIRLVRSEATRPA